HAVVASPSVAPLQQTVTRRHAPTGGRFADHSALYSSLRGRETRFHTVLCAAPAMETVSTRVLTQGDGLSALSVTLGESQLLSLYNADGATVSAELPMLGSVRTDASAMHCILNPAGRPETWMLDGGSFLQADGRLLLSSSALLRAAAMFDGSEIRLNLRTAGTPGETTSTPQEEIDVALRVSHSVLSVEGAGLVSWELHGNMLQLRLADADTDLRVSLGGTPTGLADDSRDAGRNDGADAGSRLDAHAEPLQLQVFPQPASAGATLQCRYTQSTAGTVVLTLHDALGRVASTLRSTAQEAGTHVLMLPAANLVPGLYFMQLRSNEDSAVRRIVIR
ncbi:MAG: T9SS type A sorting domain-containing protein, partial [Bacteroidetes bacterium]|nr:T9SS type A sorting domain-containing protein [Bacteroidota bacterium]